jgi:peptide/nickel transport system substrate-binding protein
LRRDIRWQDGVALTARDCVFTYRAILNPRNALPTRAGYDAIASVTAPDDATVVVRLKHRYSPLIDTFLAPDFNYPILPAHVLARYGELNDVPFDAKPIGSGPFRVVAWTRGDRLMLARNDGFFRGRPRLAGMEIHFVPSPDTIAVQLATHELDAAFALPTSLVPRLRAISELDVKQTPIAGVTLLYFNTTREPLRELAVRRAIALAIDRPLLVADATAGVATARDAQRGLFSWAYRPVSDIPFDPAAAARLLDAAGWRVSSGGTRVRNGQRLGLTLVTASNVSGVWAATLQQQLARIGIDVTIKTYTPMQFSAPASAGGPLEGQNFDLAFYSLLVNAGDPDVSQYFGCAQRAPYGFNFSGLCDPALEAPQRDGMSTFDTERRVRDTVSEERALVSLVPVLVLAQTRQIDAYGPGLRGFTPELLAFAKSWEWSLAP